MKKNKLITFVGIAFTLMWVIQATYLVQYFPFTKETKEKSQQLTNEALKLPKSLQEGTVLEGKTAEAIQNQFEASLKYEWVKSLVLIVFGIIVGCLLSMNKTIGHLLALLLSLGLIVLKSYSLYARGEFHLESYALFFQYFPLNVVREIIMVLVLIITVVVLTSVYVGNKFKRNVVK
jgi:hypothetical protein